MEGASINPTAIQQVCRGNKLPPPPPSQRSTAAKVCVPRTLRGATSRSTFFTPGSKLKTQSRRGTRYSCDNTQRHFKLLPGRVSCHIPLAPASRWPRPAALRQGCRPFLHEPLPCHKVTLGMSCSHTGRGHNSWEQNLHLLCLPINTHTQTYTRPLHRASHFAKPFHSHSPI